MSAKQLSSASSRAPTGTQSKSASGERQPLRYVPPHLRQERAGKESSGGKEGRERGAKDVDARPYVVLADGGAGVSGVRKFARTAKIDQGRFTVCRYVLMAVALFFVVFALSVGLYQRFNTYGSKTREVSWSIRQQTGQAR